MREQQIEDTKDTAADFRDMYIISLNNSNSFKAVSSVDVAYTSLRSLINFLISLYETNFVELRI